MLSLMAEETGGTANPNKNDVLGALKNIEKDYTSDYLFFFSSRRRHTRCLSDCSSDVCSSDLVSSDVAFSNPYTGSESASITANWTGMPNDGSVWYWRVKAGNTVGWSSYSSPWRFVNGSSAVPPVPTHISPANGGTAAGTQVTLSWNGSAGATKYVTQVSSNAAFSNPYTGSESASITANWTGMPNDGSVWYWRVKAGNATG